MMLKKWVKGAALAVAAATGLCLASTSHAALLVYEGYDLPAGTSAVGQGSGFGWGANLWTTTTSGSANIVESSLTYSDGTNSLVTSGNHVNPISHRTYRILEQPLGLSEEMPEIWISFIGKASASGGSTGHAGVALFNGGTGDSNEVITMGKGAGGAQYWGFAGGGVLADDAKNPTSSVDATTQSFLVYKFVYNESGNADAYLWINPSLEDTPSGTPDATATLTTNLPFTRVRVSTTIGGSGAFFDELRIGTTFRDVAPVPEPATAGLLVLGGAALCLRRRRA